MADKKQLERLLDGGVEDWNRWREENPEVKVDLSDADLRSADLISADLISADLRSAILRSADLRFADLRSADLRSTDLSSAILRSAKLSYAKLRSAILHSADLSFARLRSAKLIDADLRSTILRSAKLSSAKLSSADLSSADLSSADLRSTILRSTILNSADLRSAKLIDADLSSAKLIDADLSSAILRSVIIRNTNLEKAIFDNTTISNVKLLDAYGLDKIKHDGPSFIDQNTLQLSQGQLPEIFLKGCGLSAWEILSAKLHNPKLTSNQITDIIYEMDRLRNEAPLQVHNLFISYSHGDARFVDRIEGLFDAKDVRYWRDMKDATAGPLDQIVVRAMRQNPTVLLVFSQHSVNSDWVEFELQKARELEKEMGRYIICPVALDDSWRTAKWSPILLNQIKKYNILDFSRWEDAAFLETQFTKLLNGLHLFYKEDRKEE